MKTLMAFLSIFFLLLISFTCFSQTRTLVPGDFNVPGKFEGEKFRIRALIAHDVVSDYSGKNHSDQSNYGLQLPALDMPANDFPTQEDLIGSALFNRRFQPRNSFSFPVENSVTGKMIGFIYINHSKNPDHDAEVTWWLRTNEPEGRMFQSLSETLKDWVKKEWPFKNPEFIGQAIPL
jgi:hypothetical protein